MYNHIATRFNGNFHRLNRGFLQKRPGSLAVLLYSFFYYKIVGRLLNLSLINQSIVLLCFKV